MRYVGGLIVICGLFQLGCTEAVPSVKLFSEDYNAPSFGGATQKTFVIQNYNSSLAVSGNCDQRTATIKLSTDAGITWQTPPTSGADLDCTDGTFSFTIPDCSTMGALTAVSPPGTQIKVYLRSEGEDTTSKTSFFNIQLQSAFQIRYANIISSGGKFAGTQHKVFGSSGSIKSSGTFVGANHKIHLTGGN